MYKIKEIPQNSILATRTESGEKKGKDLVKATKKLQHSKMLTDKSR